MLYEIIKGDKCSTECIYFQDPMLFNNVEIYYDDNGVKHNKHSKKYVCLYDNTKIKFNSKCNNCKQKVRIYKTDNNENY